MKHYNRPILIVSLLLAAFYLAPSYSYAKEYYIWTDRAGTVHITDNPGNAPKDSKVAKYPEKAAQAPEAAEPSVTELEKLIITEEGKTKEKPAPEEPKCKTLDTREFGLIGDSLTEPWSEVTLVEKYGPPCEIIHLGEVFFETGVSRTRERRDEKNRLDKDKKDLRDKKERGFSRSGFFAEKKQFVYRGDYTNRTTVITIIGGRVVSKERLFE